MLVHWKTERKPNDQGETVRALTFPRGRPLRVWCIVLYYCKDRTLVQTKFNDASPNVCKNYVKKKKSFKIKIRLGGCLTIFYYLLFFFLVEELHFLGKSHLQNLKWNKSQTHSFPHPTVSRKTGKANLKTSKCKVRNAIAAAYVWILSEGLCVPFLSWGRLPLLGCLCQNGSHLRGTGCINGSWDCVP